MKTLNESTPEAAVEAAKLTQPVNGQKFWLVTYATSNGDSSEERTLTHHGVVQAPDNIDTEGTSVSLFNALPWESLKGLKLICVEHDFHLPEVKLDAQAHGFEPLAMNPENIILLRRNLSS